MKLALGTVQFGMNYGICNFDGQPNFKTVELILNMAKETGIHVLDTANAYGVSEEILGEILESDESFQIVTKTCPLKDKKLSNLQQVKYVQTKIEQSFERLKKNSIYGMLVHHGEELLTPSGQEIYSILTALKQSNRIKKIGVSVSDPELLKKIIDQFEIDLVQIPLNILDQRMIKAGLINSLHSKGIEIHARSAFLQGALINNSYRLPPSFSKADGQLNRLTTLAGMINQPKMALALQFLKNFKEVNQIVIGVQNIQQLQECIDNYLKEICIDDFSEFECNELSVIDPSQWLIHEKQ